MDFFLKLLGALALLAAAILWAVIAPAFVALDCYEWFIRPVLNTPEFTIYHFMGFSMFMSVFVPRDMTSAILKKEFKIDNYWITGITGPILSWILAWALHLIIT
jgi:hypothetical protein